MYIGLHQLRHYLVIWVGRLRIGSNSKMVEQAVLPNSRQIGQEIN